MHSSYFCYPSYNHCNWNFIPCYIYIYVFHFPLPVSLVSRFAPGHFYFKDMCHFTSFTWGGYISQPLLCAHTYIEDIVFELWAVQTHLRRFISEKKIKSGIFNDILIHH
jgi:hypothetical protein